MHPRRGAKEAGEPGYLLRNVQDAAPTESIVTSNLAIQRWLDKTVSDRGDVASALVMLGTPENAGHLTRDSPAIAPPAESAREHAAQTPPQAAGQDGDELLKLMRTTLAAPKFDRCAATLATERASACACSRVFVGMSERRRWEAEVARFENTYAEAQAKQDRT